MKTRLLWACLLLGLPQLLFAQEYRGWLTTVDPLGTEFTKKGKLIKPVTFSKNVDKNRELAKKFSETNEFYIDRFLNSGVVLTGTKANRYINSVADKLLVKRPALRKEIKLYIVYSSEVNAFTFTNGMIFFNIGLLSRLENESQLAYIMAHEIAHYLEKHAMERYERTAEVEEEAEENDEDDNYLGVILSKFNREQEFEADSKGLEIFLESGYQVQEAISVFEILKKADLPLENVRIPKTVFEGKYLKIPDVFYSEESIDLVIPAEESDTNKTHPNSSKRQEVIRGKVKGKEQSGSMFLVDKSTFEQVREACRFELVEVYIWEHNFINALYLNEILLIKYPENPRLMTNKIKALYFFQTDLNDGRRGKVVSAPKRINGEIRKFHFLFKKLNKQEYNALFLRQGWDIYNKMQGNKVVKMFCNEITRNFESAVSKDINFFYKLDKYDLDLINGLYSKEDTVSNKKKYTGTGTVKRSSKKRNQNFAMYSMPDYLTNADFVKTFKELGEGIADAEEANEENEESENLSAAAAKEKEAKKKKNQKPENSFSTDKILLIGISSLKVDTRSETPVKFKEIQETQLSLAQEFKEIASMLDIEVEVFNPVALKTDDAEKYEARNLLDRWLVERNSYKDKKYFLPMNYSAIDSMVMSYGTPYVAYMQGAQLIQKSYTAIYLINVLIYAVHPPIFAAMVYGLTKPRKESMIRIPVYNILTGEQVYYYEREYDSAGRKDYVKSDIYNFFYQMKREVAK